MSERPHQTARLASGLPLAAGLIWGVHGLAAGGLAPLLVAAGVAILIGAPLATQLWARARRDDTQAEAMRTSARVCATLVAAGVAAVLAPDDLAGMALGTGLLGLAILIVQVRSGLAILLGLAGAAGAMATTPAAPWTLLEPSWSSWQSWLPLSVGTGMLLAGAGFGSWSGGDAALPGYRRGPWLTVGLGITVLTASAIVWGQQFEHSMGLERGFTGPLPWLLMLGTAMGWADRATTVGVKEVAGLLLAFWWLNSPLTPAPDAFWPILLTLPGLVGALFILSEERGARRAPAALTLIVCGGALLVAWPGFGPSALAASMAVVPILLVLWTGGTRLAIGVR